MVCCLFSFDRPYFVGWVGVLANGVPNCERIGRLFTVIRQ